ncbi:MAG: hypothetical protein JWM90_1218 [Thermoleophilia bacterium]|nr:hypothetical protein [Thermoleophilia bacterium]
MRSVLTRLQPFHVAVLAWVVAFVTYSVQVGLPTKRSNVLVWMILAILALGVARPRRTLRALLVDWSPMIVALVAYDLLRGLSDNATRVAHTWPHLDLDEWLGAGQSLSVRLQDLFHTPGQVTWFDYPVWAVYTSHFLVPLGIAVALWAMGSMRFRPYLYGLTLLSWFALATYYLYPAQPPWMTAKLAGNDDVARIVHGMWKEVGIDRAARVWEPSTKVSGSKYSNPVAALPSLHAAFPFFIFISMLGIRRWLSVLLGTYAAAMGFVLIYAGEHFLFDILLGWAFAALAAWLMAVAFRHFRGTPAAAPELDADDDFPDDPSPGPGPQRQPLTSAAASRVP